MLSNQAEFEVLLERYDDNPGVCSKLLRTHAQSEPQTFLVYAQKALLERPVARGLKFIAGLAITAGLIEILLFELYPRSRETALALGGKLIACDPRFDHTLLDFLQRAKTLQVKEEQILHVGLDILSAISPGDHLVAAVLKLLKHPNPRVRSKAALFVGNRTQNLAWAANGNQDYDPRVRANIIESLYGLNSDFVVQMFRDNVGSENNRVAGNAVLGLYLLGHSSSIPLIYEMSNHPEARFRITAAWIMGRTGDPRFASAFSELMNDPDENVRAQVFKGLREVKNAIRRSEKRPNLKAVIMKAERGEWSSIIATVRYPDGLPVQGISPTSFIVKAGAKPVRSYVVNEYDCRKSLNVAFIMCLPEENEEQAETKFTRVIQECNGLRRSKDRWAILKIGSKSAGGTSAGPGADTAYSFRNKLSILKVDFPSETQSVSAPAARRERQWVEYSANPATIDAMLRESPISLNQSAADEETARAINALLRVDFAASNPHLIFLAESPKTHLVPALTAKSADLGATVHVLSQSTAWDTEKVRELVTATGGMHRSAGNEAFSQLCVETYSSLLHHYRIGWQEGGSGNLTLEIHSENGRASASYETRTACTPEDRLTA